jgi:hypothetical protein
LESKQKITDVAPGFLKDFLPFISPKLFEIINIPDLSIKMSKIGFNFLFNKGVEDNSKLLEKFLPENIEYLTIDSSFSENSSVSSKVYGEIVLELYFSQINSTGPIFLDLRPERFNLSDKKVIFEPNGMWFDFSKNFRSGLSEVYEGFYQQKDDLFEKGLTKIKLIDETDSEEIKKEMKKLFSAHFGDALYSEIKFSMKDFQESFHQVFSFLFKQGKQLPSEFTFLGIYLVTLYLNLSSLGECLDVKGAYLRANLKSS